jgi:hypothetical protein
MVTAAFSAGCTFLWPTPKAPNLGVDATGDGLWIRTQAHQAAYVEKEKVGEAIHKDDTGKTIGTTDVYEDRVRTVEWETWYPMQGNVQLDDEDFLRIVGDNEALAKHREYRKTGLTMNKLGKGMMIGGLAAFVGSLFVPADQISLRSYVTSGAWLVGAGGWYFARAGANRFKADAHTIDANRANWAIQEYNTRLGGKEGSNGPSASLSVGGQF